jgi:putative membrane protein
LFFTLAFLALVMDFHIYYLPTILALIVLLPFSFLLSRYKWVQRFFTHPQDRAFQVLERAEIEFHRHQMQQTVARTGVLIFLSLMERQAVVLGDKSIAVKLTPNTWQDVVQTIVSGVRSGKTESGLLDAVKMCGSLLKQHFPATGYNPNELADRVIVKD